MKVIIVGGVAGGASCAARLRRLDERAEIILVERGEFVSYANCGLPYHVGGVIEQESSLLVSSPQILRAVFAIDCRVRCEVIGIAAAERTVEIRNLDTGEVIAESYDELVLSPGAFPVRPPLPGIDLPGIFSVRTINDARHIRQWLERERSQQLGETTDGDLVPLDRPKRAVIVGGGYIGLEMAENLTHRGIAVTILEMLDQVMSPLDPECARLVERHLQNNGVSLAFGDAVAGFRQMPDGSLEVDTADGATYAADLVVLAIGVRPETALARSAGLEIGKLGGIRVDEHMRTSDAHIFAVGDAVEVRDYVTGEWSLVALAGPANRQGRIAADVIAGRTSRFRGTQGTSVIGLFDGTVAFTGASEKTLARLGWDDYEKVYLFPRSHAGYYPGAQTIVLKLVYRGSDGRILGAQALGKDGVEKRIDAIALAIQLGATVYDLEEAELCYAPQYGSAKDAVNFAGMVAADVLRDDMPIVHWTELDGCFLLDVRSPQEFAAESAPRAVNIPLPLLRDRLDELPRDRRIAVICRSGVRAYYATRILAQNGFEVRNVSGGMLSRSMGEPV